MHFAEDMFEKLGYIYIYAPDMNRTDLHHTL